MSSFMIALVTNRGKTPVTIRAFIRVLSRVNSLVYFEITLLRESFATSLECANIIAFNFQMYELKV